jgi:hypothetical protein
MLPAQAAFAGAIPIDLGAAASFAVLAGSAVTNTGATVANGDLGVWPNDSVTGFPSGVVVGGNIYAGDATAMQAEASLTTAYLAAADETGAQSLSGLDLGGMTLLPGVYSFSSSAQLTGVLTLNADNVSNAVFIFQITSTLTTAASSLVQMSNFGVNDQIIWQVGSSATLGTDTAFAGDILALTSITMQTGASISCGGALALNGAVSLQDNSVSLCAPGETTVPEPGSIGVFLAGLAGCASMNRKRLRAVPGAK